MLNKCPAQLLVIGLLVLICRGLPVVLRLSMLVSSTSSRFETQYASVFNLQLFTTKYNFGDV